MARCLDLYIFNEVVCFRLRQFPWLRYCGVRVLLPTHDASVHRMLKLLSSITACRVQHSLSCSNLSFRKRILQLQHKRSSKFHPPGNGLAFHPEYVCSDLTGFSGLHPFLRYVFYCHQMNQRLCIYVILPS